MNKIEQNLQKYNITLPAPQAPLADYLPYRISGNMLYISGQGPLGYDGQICGIAGNNITIEDAQAAARQAAINCLAQAKIACDGDLSRLKACIKLTGYVACMADFTEHPTIINGASSIMVAALGDAGKHARVAIGCAALPLGWVVEIESLFEIV